MRICRLVMALPLVALLISATYGQMPAKHAKPGASHPRVAAKPFVLPPVSRTPLQPVPMDMLPAAAPQVTYRDGMLTILAQNSTLGDVLREVHKHTGATIDVPPNANERVAARLGPGPARVVLADLLNGSAFNYVMIGKDSDPGALVSVSLTSKPAGGAPTETVAYQPSPQYVQPQMGMPIGGGPGGPVAQQPADDESADAEEEAPEENGEGDQDQAETNAAANENQAPNSGPRNPQEILEMLRKQMPIPGQQGIPGQGGVNPPGQPPQQPPSEQPQ